MAEVLEIFGGGKLLAPMAGVNDPVFRGICSSLGADLTYTEMVSAKGLA
jgi:tRNA-dihydrouridine synthase B